MPRVVMKPEYFAKLLWLAVPISAYIAGRKLQNMQDEDYTKFRNKSQLFGGRKESVW